MKKAAAAVVVVPMEKMDAVASLREIVVGCGFCSCFAGMFSAEANSVHSKPVSKAVRDLIVDI